MRETDRHSATLRCDKCLERIDTSDAVPVSVDGETIYLCHDCWVKFDPRDE
jgi:hypothetical protein